MKNIFFIRNAKEFDVLRKKYFYGGVCKDLVFGYRKDPPFLSKSLYGIPGVSRWEDHVPVDVSSEGIWLKEYRNIEEKIGRIFSGSGEPVIFNNKYFIFGLVKDYGNFLRECNSIFSVLKKYKPGNIYIGSKEGFFYQLVFSFGRKNGVAIKNI